MPKDDDGSRRVLETIELHRLETQWVRDLADDHEFRGGPMVVVAYLPGGKAPADSREIGDRVFHLFLAQDEETDLLIRENPNDKSNDDLTAFATSFLSE